MYEVLLCIHYKTQLSSRNFESFVQFKKQEKHPWRRVTLSKVASFSKVTLLHGSFSDFLYCTNGTKSCKASYMLFFWLNA